MLLGPRTWAELEKLQAAFSKVMVSSHTQIQRAPERKYFTHFTLHPSLKLSSPCGLLVGVPWLMTGQKILPKQKKQKTRNAATIWSAFSPLNLPLFLIYMLRYSSTLHIHHYCKHELIVLNEHSTLHVLCNIAVHWHSFWVHVKQIYIIYRNVQTATTANHKFTPSLAASRSHTFFQQTSSSSITSHCSKTNAK